MKAKPLVSVLAIELATHIHPFIFPFKHTIALQTQMVSWCVGVLPCKRPLKYFDVRWHQYLSQSVNLKPGKKVSNFTKTSRRFTLSSRHDPADFKKEISSAVFYIIFIHSNSTYWSQILSNNDFLKVFCYKRLGHFKTFTEIRILFVCIFCNNKIFQKFGSRLKQIEWNWKNLD